MDCHGQHDETQCGDCAIWWRREAERLQKLLGVSRTGARRKPSPSVVLPPEFEALRRNHARGANLEDREMCAEFAVPNIDWMSLPGMGKVMGAGLEAPHFEEDPASACSLLPKLIKAMLKREACEEINHGPSDGTSPGDTELFLEALSNELNWTDDFEVCQFIIEAVRKVKEAKHD